MKKRSESGFTRHLIANIVLLLLVVFLILVFSGRKNYSRQIEQIDEYINALSSRTAQHVSDVFQDKLSSIRSIAYLYGQALGSAEVAPEYLAALEENSGFDRIRFIDREGISRASDGTTADVSDRDYYQKGLQGESGHTAVLASRFNGSKLVGFYAPVYYQGEICGVMGGFMEEQSVSAILQTDLYGYPSFTVMVSPDGTILGQYQTPLLENTRDLSSALAIMQTDDDEKLLEAIRTQSPVSFSFTGTAGKSAGNIQPIAGTEWSLLQLFPSEAAWQLANEVTSDERLAMLLFVVAILTSSGQFVYIIRRKAELEHEQESRSRVNSLLQSISDDYILLINVNLNTEQEELFRLQGESTIKGPPDNNFHYPHRIERYIQNVVAPHDRQRLQAVTQLPALQEVLSRQKDFYVEYDAIMDGETHRLQTKFTIDRNNPKELHMLVGVRDITELTHERIRNQTSIDLIVSAASTVYPFILEENLTRNEASTVYNCGIVNSGVLECIILSVNDTYMDAQEVMHMTDYSKITALYSRLSVGDEDRDGGESNSIQNQKIFLENYARGQHLTNIRHYIDDDESGRFFDRSAYSRMMDDVENGKIGVCIMKDLTRWGRDYLQVGNAMEIFRRNNVRFIAVNNGIDSEKPDTLEFAPFINIMSEWYAKDISKKVKTGIKTKGMSGKPIVTEAPYGYVKDPDNKDFWIIDEEAAEVVRLIFRLFIGGKNRNQIAVYLTQEQIPTPTFYMKDRGRGTCKNKTLNEDNRCKWNKATLTNILTRQEYCGDVVNFKTTKHFRDKHNHYVDRSQWHITENVHEPIISRSDFETVQRILGNAPVRRPNGDGEIHPLSGLLFCKDCGAKMHIRIDYRNGGKRHVAFCSEYHKGKAKNPKCHSPHIMDADLLMQTIAEVLKKIEDYSISNRAEFEALVKKNLAMQQTDQTKKQQKRIPQITTRLEQIDKVLNKLYEDNALGTIPQDRYEQMSQKYSEEYYTLKAELATLQEQLSAFENAGGRAQKFLKLTERHAAFTELTPAILNEFISRIEVHERDQKRARYAIQHISIYFNYIGKFENEVTQLAEPTEQEIRQMREEIEEAKKEKSRAYHRNYSREYRARNLEKQREYDRMKAREYRARRKAQAAAAQPTQ